MMRRWEVGLVSGVAGLAACGAMGAGFGDFDAMSDGSDGALVVSSSTTVSLGKAAEGNWQDPSPVAGNGVFDPSVFAVVYKYSSVEINSTLSFANHPKGAPVVWLVQGDVTINSGIVLDGGDGTTSSGANSYAQPGPGGFAGGKRDSNGFGPGGGDAALFDGATVNGGGGGGFAQAGGMGDGAVIGGLAYSNFAVFPLIGGSGGGGDSDNDCSDGGSGASGGAGGGAILIAATGTITVNGAINARGGDGGDTNQCGGAVGDSALAGGGSGGAIKLMANEVIINGSNRLNATGGDGGDSSGVSGGDGSDGRIRIEAFALDVDTGATNPEFTTDTPGDIFPDAMTPTLRAVSVAGNPISPNPGAGIQTIDGVTTTTAPVTLEIEATNIEPGQAVDVIIFQAEGNPLVFQSTPLAGTFAFSTASAVIQLNSGVPGDIVLRVEEGDGGAP